MTLIPANPGFYVREFGEHMGECHDIIAWEKSSDSDGWYPVTISGTWYNGGDYVYQPNGRVCLTGAGGYSFDGHKAAHMHWAATAAGKAYYARTKEDEDFEPGGDLS